MNFTDKIIAAATAGPQCKCEVLRSDGGSSLENERKEQHTKQTPSWMCALFLGFVPQTQVATMMAACKVICTLLLVLQDVSGLVMP